MHILRIHDQRKHLGHQQRLGCNSRLLPLELDLPRRQPPRLCDHRRAPGLPIPFNRTHRHQIQRNTRHSHHPPHRHSPHLRRSLRRLLLHPSLAPRTHPRHRLRLRHGLPLSNRHLHPPQMVLHQTQLLQRYCRLRRRPRRPRIQPRRRPRHPIRGRAIHLPHPRLLRPRLPPRLFPPPQRSASLTRPTPSTNLQPPRPRPPRSPPHHRLGHLH